MKNIHSVATYFDVEVQQEEGCFPKVKICADVQLVKYAEVKSIDAKAIKQALQSVLEGGAVEFVEKPTTTSDDNPPVSKN